MQQPDEKQVHRGRRSPRVDLEGEVTIRFAAASLVGPGENISLDGVFFTTEGCLPVVVQVAGRGDVAGKLVRLESMGDGRIGMAVRFDDRQPSLVPEA